MKPTKISIVILINLLSILCINAQTKVVKIEQGAKLPKEYVTYFLPRTDLWAEVKVKTTIQQPGRFANYASRLLAIDNVITKKTITKTIESIDLIENIMPDSTKYYAVEINTRSVAYRINKTYNGIITGINTSINSSNALEYSKEDYPIDTTIRFDYSFLSEDVLKASTEFKMAEITAQQILDIRNTRMEILTGESEQEYDSETMKIVLSRLDDTEQRLMEFFSGKSVIYYETQKIQIPLHSDIKEAVLFRFSDQFGIMDKDNYTGTPIFFSVKANFAHDKTNTTKSNKTGIYYNVPGSAVISISDIDKQWLDRTIVLPQFGYQRTLPATIFSKQTTAVIFNQYGEAESIK